MGVFKNAAKVKTAPKAKGKAAKPELMLAGVKNLAAVKTVIKSLEGLAGTLDAEVKRGASDWYAAFAKENKKKPENPVLIDAEDSNIKGSMQFRKRSSASVLNADEKALLDDHKISYDTEVVKEETFIVNSKYSQDWDLLEKIEEALEGIVPDDFFLKQDKMVKHTVGEKTIDEIAKKPQVRKLMEVALTLSTRLSMDEQAAYEVVGELLGEDDIDD